MDVSIIIPLYNEEESLVKLNSWIVRVLKNENLSYQIIYIDDGSTDDSWETIESLSNKNPNVSGIRLGRNFGKSQALHAGFKIASGEVVITMDADLQDSPDEIPKLYSAIKKNNFDLISGWKKKRKDPVLTKNLPSKLFNFIARISSGLKLHDFNCGLKAYKREVVQSIDVYGEMHRYIPILAKNAGFTKITELPVEHRARQFGKTKFGSERFFNGFLDLISLQFISRFGGKPMHFFGFLGIGMFFIGFLSSGYIGVSKLIALQEGRKAILVTDNAWFYISLVAMILGVQLFLAGFLGELIVKTKKDQRNYIIRKTLNIKK